MKDEILVPQRSSPEEIGNAFKTFINNIRKYGLPTEEDIIKFFSNKENKDACESFMFRHPQCPYGKYIPK